MEIKDYTKEDVKFDKERSYWLNKLHGMYTK